MYLRTMYLLVGMGFPLAAQEVTPELRNDITEVVAADVAGRLQRLGCGLGEAFNRQVFVETLAEGLRSGRVAEDIGGTRCPMAADIANGVLKRFEPRDFDVEHALARIGELSVLPAPATDEEKEKQWAAYMQLYDRMAAAYRPVLRLREAEKEKQILAVNRRRPGVVVLPNGVQMQVEQGDDALADINRGTRETGVAFYTRTTRKMDFAELPEPIRRMSEHIPPARSWTFWVPAESMARLDAEKQQRRAEEKQRREELMQQLSGPQQNFYDSQPWSSKKRRPAEKAPEKQPEPMLKIKIWKDDANAPVQTLPDVVQDML